MIDWNRVKEELLKIEKIKSPSILKAAETCLAEAVSLIQPKTISIEKRVLAVDPDFIEIEGPVKFHGVKLSSYLKGAASVRIFLVTIGPSLEEKASLLMSRHEELNGYMLDRIGSIAAESLAENFEEDLRRSCLLKNLSVSMRFSPGYCDWVLEDQFKLDKILDFSRAGVNLNGSCMMVPRKSISAMSGIGPGELFSRKMRQCNICSLNDCDYRRNS